MYGIENPFATTAENERFGRSHRSRIFFDADVHRELVPVQHNHNLLAAEKPGEEGITTLYSMRIR